MDSVHLRGAQLRLTMPWHPDDTLHGAKRDSAIRFNLARKDHEVRRTRGGFTQNYRWTNAYVAMSHARIADPDSIGRLFLVDTLHAVETVPTFRWRNVSATVRVLGDSVWVEGAALGPARLHGHAPRARSCGEATSPCATPIRIFGDTVSLNDVAWVYPTLPRTGGGSMVLDIKNEQNLQRLDYAITQDGRSHDQVAARSAT